MAGWAHHLYNEQTARVGARGVQGWWNGEKKTNFSFLTLEKLSHWITPDHVKCIWCRRTIWKRAIDNSIGLLNLVRVRRLKTLTADVTRKPKLLSLAQTGSAECEFPRNQDHSCWFVPFGYLQIKQVIFGLLGKETWCGHHPQQPCLMSNQKHPCMSISSVQRWSGDTPRLRYLHAKWGYFIFTALNSPFL